MSTDIKISVIIPVYNVERYLNQCIDSVLSQNYKNIEIILVDDGSTDNSPHICDRYASECPDKVKVIHKANGGLSDARNHGIASATGDYIIFLDGDDFWNKNSALSLLVARLSLLKTDVVSFSYTKFFEDTNKSESYFSNMVSMPLSASEKEEQLKYLFNNNYFIASACNKLIKRQLFDNTLLFEPDVYSEDVEWCAKLLIRAESFDFVAENFYSYRQRRDSISHTINDKKCNDLCKHILECFKMISNSVDSNKEFLSIYTAFQYGTFFVVQALAENAQNECIDNLTPYSEILKYHNGNKKLWVLMILCKTLGYKNTCKLIRFFYKRRRK